jgi:hypothetical protein
MDYQETVAYGNQVRRLEKMLIAQLGEERFKREMSDIQAQKTRKRKHEIGRKPSGKAPSLKEMGRMTHVIPINDFIRAHQMDPDFWADDKSVKYYERINPDSRVIE